MFRAILHAACIGCCLLGLLAGTLRCLPGTPMGQFLSPGSYSHVREMRGNLSWMSESQPERLGNFFAELTNDRITTWTDGEQLLALLSLGLSRSLFLLCGAFGCVIFFANRRGEETASAAPPIAIRIMPPGVVIFALFLGVAAVGAAPLRGIHGVMLEPLIGIERWLDLLRHAIAPVVALALVGIGVYRFALVPPPRSSPEAGWRIESSGRACLTAMTGALCVVEPICGWNGLGWMISRAAFQFDLPVLLIGVFTLAAVVTFLQAGCEVLRRGLVGGFLPWRKGPSVSYVETAASEVGADQRRVLTSLKGSRRAKSAAILGVALLLLIGFVGLGGLPPDQLTIGQFAPGLPPAFLLPFGTDAFGRNACAESLRAVAVSLLVTLAVTVGAMVLGGLFSAPVAALFGRRMREAGWHGAPLRLVKTTLSRFPTAPTALLVAALIRPDSWGMLTALATALALRTGEWVGSPTTPAGGWSVKTWACWCLSRSPGFAMEALAVETGLSLVGLGPRLPWPTLGEWLGHLAAVAPHPTWALLLPFLWLALAALALDLLGGVMREMRWAP